MNIKQLGITGLVLSLIVYVLRPDKKKKVFVSFNYAEDVRLRNLIEAWNENTRFDFSIDRISPITAIRSEDDSVIKRALTTKLKQSEYLLVIVGEKTFESEFVRWEIERAMEPDVNLKIAAVKKNPRCKLPKELKEGRATWTSKFSLEGINSVLSQAKRIHA